MRKRILRELADNGAARSAPRGMTLVEIMIVLTIMASIMGVVSVYVFGAIDRAGIKEAQTEVETLKGYVDMYWSTSTPHEYPSSLDDLTSGPAPITKKIPKDPWGHDYIYQKPSGNSAEATVCSVGPDESQGTDDDICAGGQE